MRIGIIINPVSGRAGRRSYTGARRAALARALLGARRTEAEVCLTRGPGHAAELARMWMARGCDRLIAWGGDGTVSDVAGPLLGTAASLGIIRSGTGDGFGRGLGIPRDPVRAFAIALGPHTRAFDVGRFGDRHFLNVAGVGFDADVAEAFHARRERGVVGYLTDALVRVWTYHAAPYQLDLDGTVLDDRLFLVAFANGRQYGNEVVLAPDADPTDGELDVLVVAAGTPLQQFWRARRLFIRRRHPAAGLSRLRVRTAHVSGDRLVCHLDGEPFTTSGTMRVSIEPAALRVAVPATAAARE